MKFIVPTGSQGDTYDRYRVRYEEMLQSIRIIKQALDMMPQTGDVKGCPIKLIGPTANPGAVLVRKGVAKRRGPDVHDTGQAKALPDIPTVTYLY